MANLILEWMLAGAIMVAIVCVTALAIYATVALIREAREALKK